MDASISYRYAEETEDGNRLSGLSACRLYFVLWLVGLD